MRKILLSLFVLLFVGCSTSSLEVSDQKRLTFSFNSHKYSFASKVDERKFLNFKDLFVEQYRVFDSNGAVLFYENAYTSLTFEFNFGGLYTAMAVFDDSNNYEEIYRSNNLRLVQIQLKDKKYVNVLIVANDTQEMSFIYGFSNKDFYKMATKLNKIKPVYKDGIAPLKYKGVTFTKNSSFATNWSNEIVFFKPLIVPLRVMVVP